MSEPELEVEFPALRYDITMPLVDGRGQVDGVRLKTIRGRSDPAALKEGNFGVRDQNVSNWIAAIDNGWDMIGLPVFSKRKPVYEYIFCRADRGVDSPKDLEGRRIGTKWYRISTTIWLRGILQHVHGVDVSTFRWVVSATDEFPMYDTNAHIEMVTDSTNDPARGEVQRLLDGDVDAVITDISDRKLFEILETDPRVKRLFPNYAEEDYRLYQETGILYTPAHLLVMSKKLDREHPELAGKLYAALEKAKEAYYDDALSDRAGFGVVYQREWLQEQMARWGDAFRYGITANRATIDAFLDYNHEQGMTRNRLSYEDVFAGSTLDT